MQKVLFAVLGIATLAAACGSSSKTVTLNFGSGANSFSMVVSGDSNAIDGFKSGVQQGISTGAATGANVTQVDGDQHQGNQVCQTDVMNSGVTLHVIVYSQTSTVTPQICTSLQSAAASATP